jgi:hypothetical protein
MNNHVAHSVRIYAASLGLMVTLAIVAFSQQQADQTFDATVSRRLAKVDYRTSIYAAPDNSFNPTALSLPFIMLARYGAGCRCRSTRVNSGVRLLLLR